MTAWEITVRQLEQAIESQRYAGLLPSKQALALKLRDEGKTELDIARYFGVTPTAGKLLLQRAERRFEAMSLLKDGNDVKEIARKMRISMNAAHRLIARME